MEEEVAKTVDIVRVLDLADPAVTWLLVVAGWFVVWRQQAHFIQRQEIRRLIDKIVKQVDELERVAEEYWLKTGQSPEAQALARVIKRAIRDVFAEFKILANVAGLQVPVNRQIAYRQALTDGDFDSRIRPALDQHDERFLRIRLESGNLKRYLEGVYAKTFPINWGIRRRLRGADRKEREAAEA